MKRISTVLLAAAAVLSVVPFGLVADPVDEQPRPVYGRDFMTESEIAAFRERLQAAEKEQERRRIRAEQHAMVQERARAMGVAIPEAVPDAHFGNSPGAGRGRGDSSAGSHRGGNADRGTAYPAPEARPGDRDPAGTKIARGDAGDSRGGDKYDTRTGPYGDKQKSKRPGKGR